MDVVKVPGPDHPITLTGHEGRIQALYNGHLIADSADVIWLKEASYKGVAYFPREDVEMGFLAGTDLDTYCPYKGHASYFTVNMDGHIAENAVWSYETPHPAMELIRGRVAFYPNVIDIHVVGEKGPSIAATVQHTDSGTGSPQDAPWTVTAPNPEG
ncbi:MAG TPA: DUF427 domain-containing protein [Caulobacteraceae bacterium]|jgi:uncharacterized protein (DUF427 family)